MVKVFQRQPPKATPAALVRLFSQLAMAARSGLPIAEAMQILTQDLEGEAGSRDLLLAIARSTAAGGSLSDALQKSGGIFPAQTVALVRQGERSGVLPQVLELLARDLDHKARFRAATRGAIVWPLTAFIFFLVILLVMCIFVVPVFEGLFASFEANLPAPTRLLIGTSHVVANGWPVLVPLVVVLVFLIFSRRGRWEWLQAGLDATVMRAPIVRSYVAKTLASRLASALLAVAEGAPLREVLAHLLASLDSRRFAAPIEALESRVASGLSLADAVAATPELPGRVRIAVALGRRTDRLAAALKQTVEVSDDEAERSLVRLEQVTLAAAYAVVGILVGFMVTAMYLPIFKMGSVI